MIFGLVIASLISVSVLYVMIFGTVFDEEKSALYNFGTPALVTLPIVLFVVFFELMLGVL